MKGKGIFCFFLVVVLFNYSLIVSALYTFNGENGSLGDPIGSIELDFFSKGIAWDGVHIYCLNNDKEIVKIDSTNGVILERIKVDFKGRNQDSITWDGTYFWVVENGNIFDGDEEIYKIYTFNGIGMILANYKIPSPSDCISWDGTSILFASYDGQDSDNVSIYRLCRLNPFNGQIQKGFRFFSKPYGITVDGTYLWSLEGKSFSSSALYKRTLSGAVVDIYDLPSGLTSVSWDGDSIGGPYVLMINTNNRSIQKYTLPPDPSTIQGPRNGEINKMYNYSFRSFDPNDDNVSFIIDWGNEISEHGPFRSGEENYISHSWSKKGEYDLKVRSVDEHGAFSSHWSMFEVSMPISYLLNPIIWYMLHLINRFPLFESMLISYLEW